MRISSNFSSRKNLIFIAFLFSGLITCAQTKEHLDSLYNDFINIRNPEINNSLHQSISNTFHSKCGFSITNEVKAYLDLFTKDQQNVLRKYLNRPDLTESIISPYGKFRLHYNITGDNIPEFDETLGIEENVNQAALALDSAYRFIVENLGYPPPPGDYGEGGDDLYDVYITGLGNVYGTTQDESPIGENTWTSFIKINNDFTGFFTTGLNAFKVTAAHELFHAIQIGNYYYQPQTTSYTYFFEMNSTAMEDFVFTDVNEYYNEIKDYFRNPSKPFYTYLPRYDNVYALAVWPIFLKEKYGYGIIKRQWELFSNLHNPLKAIEESLAENNTQFKEALNIFGLWSYYTGERKSFGINNEVFDEGEFYPELQIPLPIELTKSEFSIQNQIKPVSNLFFQFVSKMNAGYIDTVISIITNGDVESAINNPDSYSYFQYYLYNYKSGNSTQISDRLFSKISSDDSRYYAESNIVNNNVHNYIEEAVFAFPMPFSYKGSVSILYLPVVYDNEYKSAEIKIYSVSMNLVYSGKKEISQKNDKFIVCWDGLDNNKRKLSTGVYIFTTENNGKLKTGKLVIKNE